MSIPPTRRLRTVGGIVAFHPDPSGLLRLVATTAPDVTRVVVFANSPLNRSIKERLAAAAGATPVTVMAPRQNVGLGKAYNKIVELARLEGAEFVLLFDQDSLPSLEWCAGSRIWPTNLGGAARNRRLSARRRSSSLLPRDRKASAAIETGIEHRDCKSASRASGHAPAY